MNVEQISVISAIIGITAVTICSMLTAIFTQRGTRKTRQFELFFEARASAYYNFLCACEKYSDIDDLTQINSLYEASARALLFASPATQKWIVKYQESQDVKLRAQKDGASYDERLKLADEVKKTRGELIQLMQLDLQSDHLRPRLLRRQNPYEDQLGDSKSEDQLNVSKKNGQQN